MNHGCSGSVTIQLDSVGSCPSACRTNNNKLSTGGAALKLDVLCFELEALSLELDLLCLKSDVVPLEFEVPILLFSSI